MLKRAVLVTIICLQLVRLASALASFDVVDFGGTSMNFTSAISLVNQSLLDQLNPVKTLLKASKHMADSASPVQPAKNEQHQRPLESTLIVSSTPELVKTNTPLWPGSGLALFSILFMVLLLKLSIRDAVVLCRIRHLFSRAREGICAIIAVPLFFRLRRSPLIRLRVDGDFLF